MKRPALALLFVIFAFPACQTVHHAAVGTFRVIDAPHQYVRRKLVGNEQAPIPAEANIPADGPTYPQPFREQAPPPPPEQRVVTTERTVPSAPEATPPPPRVTTRTTTTQSRETKAQTPAASKTTSAGDSSIPYGKPVPGKPGYVFSPYDKNGGYVDVTGFAPGSKVKDPYSGKVFLVP